MAKAPKPETKPDETKDTPSAQDPMAGQDTPLAQDAMAGQDTPPAAEATLPVAEPALRPVVIEVPVLQVVGPAKGRWRIGQKFTPELTVLDLADLTDAQVQALKADPELVVIETTVSSVALTA